MTWRLSVRVIGDLGLASRVRINVTDCLCVTLFRWALLYAIHLSGELKPNRWWNILTFSIELQAFYSSQHNREMCLLLSASSHWQLSEEFIGKSMKNR